MCISRIDYQLFDWEDNWISAETSSYKSTIIRNFIPFISSSMTNKKDKIVYKEKKVIPQQIFILCEESFWSEKPLLGMINKRWLESSAISSRLFGTTEAKIAPKKL